MGQKLYLCVGVAVLVAAAGVSARALDIDRSGHDWVAASAKERKDFVTLTVKRLRLDDGLMWGHLDDGKIHQCMADFLAPPVDDWLLAAPLHKVLVACVNGRKTR